MKPKTNSESNAIWHLKLKVKELENKVRFAREAGRSEAEYMCDKDHEIMKKEAYEKGKRETKAKQEGAQAEWEKLLNSIPTSKSCDCPCCEKSKELKKKYEVK